jgi:hypothetical protein
MRLRSPGEDTTRDGRYTVAAWKRSGYSFEGSTVASTLGGKSADETGIWMSRNTESLDLHAD